MGLQIKQAPGTVTVKQLRWNADSLELFVLSNCKLVATPADVSTQVAKKTTLKLGQ